MINDNQLALTAAEVRAASLASGREVREKVEQLPDSPDKQEWLRISAEYEEFWERASDAFMLHWMQVAWALQS